MKTKKGQTCPTPFAKTGLIIYFCVNMHSYLCKKNLVDIAKTQVDQSVWST